MGDFVKVIGYFALIALVLALVGFINIWALNTLFPVLNIPFTIETWFASIIIFGTLSHIRNRKD